MLCDSFWENLHFPQPFLLKLHNEDIKAGLGTKRPEIIDTEAPFLVKWQGRGLSWSHCDYHSPTWQMEKAKHTAFLLAGRQSQHKGENDHPELHAFSGEHSFEGDLCSPWCIPRTVLFHCEFDHTGLLSPLAAQNTWNVMAHNTTTSGGPAVAKQIHLFMKWNHIIQNIALLMVIVFYNYIN